MDVPTSTNPATAGPPANANTEPAAAAILIQSPKGATLVQLPHPDSGNTAIYPPSPYSNPSGDRDPSPPSPLMLPLSMDPVPMISADTAIDPEPGCQTSNDRSTPTPVAALARPLLSTAGNCAFKLDGAREDSMSETIVAYWETVPGGGRWVEMVRSYLALTQHLPVKGVSS
jgi:hypothetical protein